MNQFRAQLRKSSISLFLSAALLLSFFPVLVPVVAQSATKSFAIGSYIIPMDTTYQNMGMWKAYGLLNKLLASGIPVSWAISNTKTFNGTDFTTSSKDLRTNAVITNFNYSGGPFIIDQAHAAAALPIIQAWWAANANQPAVHEATASFSANADIVLKSAPRIALEEINSGIAIAYFNAAGIADLNGNLWSSTSPNVLTEEEIAGGMLFTKGDCSVRAYDMFVTPHNNGYTYSLTDPTNLGTRTYAELDYFVNQGGGWVALCHSILSNEAAIAAFYNSTVTTPAVRALFKSDGTAGGFLTKNGITEVDKNGGDTWHVTEQTDPLKPMVGSRLPIAQAVNTSPTVAQELPGGSIQTWRRDLVPYHAQTELIANFTQDGLTYDWAINGVAHNGQTLGKVTFLGGHSYSTSLPYTGNMEAPYLRFFYNSLFFNGSAVAKLDLNLSQQNIPKDLPSELVVKLENTGGSVASGSREISIKLAIGVEYLGMVTGYPLPTVTGNSTTGTTLYWGNALGDIPGESTALEVKIRLTPTTLGDKNIAHLEAQYGDVYGEAFKADLCRSITVYNGANLSITKTPATQTVYTGQIATWTLTYKNTGALPLTNTVVEDTLPAGFALRSSVPAPSSVTGNGTVVRWNIGALAVNETKTIQLTAFASRNVGTNYINNATVSGLDQYGYRYTAAAQASVATMLPPVELIKSVVPSGAIELTTPGDTLTYTLRPHYDGNKLLSNVLIADPVPAETTYVPGSANAGGSLGFTPIAKQDGEDLDTFGTGKSTKISLTATPEKVKKDDTVTVSMTVTNASGGAITNIIPVVQENLGGAQLLTGPSVTGFNLASGNSQVVTYTFKMTELGERRFLGSASGTVGTDSYSFSDGLSNSVLVLTDLPTANVVTWRLGSNVPGVPGEHILTGYTPGVYAFRGDNTTEFSKYSPVSNTWSSKEPPTNGIEKGGALTMGSNGVIYASEGNSKIFYNYTIPSGPAAGVWNPLTPAPVNFDLGGGIQYLNLTAPVGTTLAGEYVYAVLGNGKTFARYNVTDPDGAGSLLPNTWKTLAALPENVKGGGAITTDGTYLYVLRGDGKTDFWRYDISANTWSPTQGVGAMASAPAGVGWGGALTRIGDYIYAFRGNGKTDFWRYDIAGNTWLARAAAPGNVGDGGALTTDGTNIYAMQGKTKVFWRYVPATNTWSILPQTNFLGSTKQGGALVYDAGVPSTGLYTDLVADASLITSGDQVTITLTARALVGNTINQVTAGTVTFTGTNGATATLVSGPTLDSADNDIQNGNLLDTVVYKWTYTLTAGTNPGSVTFKVGATGTGDTNFPIAASRAVLVTPPLEMQVKVDNYADVPFDVNQIVNFGMIADQTALGNGVDSNGVTTPLLRPSLTLTKTNSPEGEVHAGQEITYSMLLRNEGSGAAQNVVISDAIPANSTYVAGSATLTGSSGVTPGHLSITQPAGLAPLKFNIANLPINETCTLTFKVKAATNLAVGVYQIKNKASLTASNHQPFDSNEVINTVRFFADFGVEKSANTEVVYEVGTVVQYQVQVTNTGNVKLTGVTVVDTKIPTLTKTSGDLNSDDVLDPGETWIYTGTYTVTATDFGTTPSELEKPLVNTVTVDTTETPAKTDSETITLYYPKLTLVKAVDKETANPGDELTYTLTLSNIGQGVANTVVISDVIPAKTSYVPGSATITSATITSGLTKTEPSTDPKTLGFGVLRLPGGEIVTMTFKVKVNQGLEVGTHEIKNKAVATVNGVSTESNEVITTVKVEIVSLVLKKVVRPDTENRKGDPNTQFVIKVSEVSNPAKGYAFDVLLKDGEEVTLKVPPGTYAIQEIAVPMEYKLEQTTYTYGNTTPDMPSNHQITLSELITTVTCYNRFGHTTYFHDDDSVKNRFSLEGTI